MPGFDGTGPAGQGPFTGRGRGFCIIPLDYSSRPSLGVTGGQNNTVSIYYPDQQVNSGFYSPLYLNPNYQFRSPIYTNGQTGYRRRGRRQSSSRGMGMRGRLRIF